MRRRGILVSLALLLTVICIVVAYEVRDGQRVVTDASKRAQEVSEKIQDVEQKLKRIEECFAKDCVDKLDCEPFLLSTRECIDGFDKMEV